ncbi:hypothetical protein ACRAWG_05050 [Methylobacterium sp. P31]
MASPHARELDDHEERIALAEAPQQAGCCPAPNVPLCDAGHQLGAVAVTLHLDEQAPLDAGLVWKLVLAWVPAVENSGCISK